MRERVQEGGGYKVDDCLSLFAHAGARKVHRTSVRVIPAVLCAAAVLMLFSGSFL